MAAPRQRDDLPPTLAQELSELWSRIQVRQVAEKLWKTHFTPAEREALGDDFPYHKLMEAVAEQRSLSLEGALVELAWASDLVSSARREALLRQLGEGGASHEHFSRSVPRWHSETGILEFQGKEAGKFRKLEAPSFRERVLAAFEESGWPDAIVNPLELDVHHASKFLADLNRAVKYLRFSSSRGGKEISWHPL